MTKTKGINRANQTKSKETTLFVHYRETKSAGFVYRG